MSSTNLNRYIKEHLKRQPKTLSMSQIEELVEYDAWLDEHGGLTKRPLDFAICAPEYHASLDEQGDRFCRMCGQPLSQ